MLAVACGRNGFAALAVCLTCPQAETQIGTKLIMIFCSIRHNRLAELPIDLREANLLLLGIAGIHTLGPMLDRYSPIPSARVVFRVSCRWMIHPKPPK